MCNKILWLDKGNQICFSKDTQTICDAYEEFLISQKVPEHENDINVLTHSYQERMSKAAAEKAKTERERILDILNHCDREAATEAAREFLKVYSI